MKQTLNQRIFTANDTRAQAIRQQLQAHGIVGLNIMASPGAGKTSLILQTIRLLQPEYRFGVIEGDVVDIDVERVRTLGVPVALANTGGACHLDAVMMAQGLASLPLPELRILIVENVGNLICPANFAIGTHANVVVASVPEGADKPYKYPGMFRGADVVVLNKIDYLEHEAFDLPYFVAGLRRINPDVTVFPVSCRTGSGMDNWLTWVRQVASSGPTE